ncbi:MAG: group 1 truncated hemoglobin [Thermocrinis sp.]|jgi:hemoglobin|nr:group 1 truncated hemoglobin [Thermocrinis sp.]
MKKALLSGLLLAGMLSAPVYVHAKEKSLYERLGGYDAISAVVNELAVRLVTDKKLGVYFKGLSNDSKRRLIAHLTDFVCSATGGPCIYTGRDMKTAHEGLGITEEDWDRFVKITKEVLDKFKVPAREQQEFLQAVAPLKSVIVEK